MTRQGRERRGQGIVRERPIPPWKHKKVYKNTTTGQASTNRLSFSNLELTTQKDEKL